MYEVFDSFLRVGTWYSGHPNDMDRFYTALSEVVEDEAFSQKAMANYMRRKVVGLDVGPRRSLTRVAGGEHPFEVSIRDLESKARTVREYLKAVRAKKVVRLKR
jgi:transposase